MAQFVVGDEVTYTPHDRRFAEPVTGFIADHLSDQAGNPGYTLLVPAHGDPRQRIRLWSNKGTFTATGQRARWAQLIS